MPDQIEPQIDTVDDSGPPEPDIIDAKPAPNLGGRPRKVDIRPNSPQTASLVAKSIPNPRFSKFNSDATQTTQRTNRLWDWWRELPGTAKEQMSAYVYRTFPILLDPVEGDPDEYKYIDVIIEPPANDQEILDRYGAGDYHIYLNTGGEKPYKRTLAEAWVRGHRNFQSQPPSDKRITAVDPTGMPKYVDFNDPQNKTYVEFLRARGIVPEIFQQKRMETEMATESVVTKLIDQNTQLSNKLAEQQRPAPAPAQGIDPQTAATLSDLKTTVALLQQQLQQRGGTDDTTNSRMLQMMLDMADRAAKANDPTKYLDTITKLNETISQVQMQRLEDRIAAMQSQMNNRGTGGAPGDPPTPDRATGLKGLMDELRAVKGFVDEVGGAEGGGAAAATDKAPWWSELVGIAMPHIAQMTGNLVQLYALSKAQGQAQAAAPPPPAPMPPPPPNPNPAAATGPQLVPPPASSTPPPSPTPGPADFLGNLMGMIQIPLFNCIEDGQSGADFAYWFENGYGEPLFRKIIDYGPSNLSIPAAQTIMMGIDNFPPLKAQFEARGIDRLQLEKFVGEFVSYNREEYERKMDQMDRGGGPAAS